MSTVVNFNDPSYTEQVNRTSRPAGVGPREPVCYRVAEDLIEERINSGKHSKEGTFVLDYGCGRDFLNGPGSRLRQQFLAAGHLFMDFWDVGESMPPAAWQPESWNRDYDLVILSSVLNVQPSIEHLRCVLAEAWDWVAPGGSLVLNFPKEPRRVGLSLFGLMTELEQLPELERYYQPQKLVFQLQKERKQ